MGVAMRKLGRRVFGSPKSYPGLEPGHEQLLVARLLHGSRYAKAGATSNLVFYDWITENILFQSLYLPGQVP